MTGPTFDAFRRRLADAVTIAINSGVKVSAEKHSGCRCPLGCLPPISDRKVPNHPGPITANAGGDDLARELRAVLTRDRHAQGSGSDGH